jgi:hypothetical protein
MEDPPGRDRLTAMSKSFQGESAMTSLARKGGIAASILLIAMGIGAMVMGVTGRDTIRSDLAREQIVGTPDSAIPGQKVDTGGEAQEFAAVIRKHTLEATGGETYAQMGRFLDESGKPTGDEAAAAKDPNTGEPVSVADPALVAAHEDRGPLPPPRTCSATWHPRRSDRGRTSSPSWTPRRSSRFARA